MSSLSSVLQMKPSTWDSTPLPAGKNYSLITLNKSSPEHKQVKTILKNKGFTLTGIEKIERVQHPFAYGRFLLRKEQLELRNGCNLEPEQIIIKVKKRKLPVVLEYNLDKRRMDRLHCGYSTIKPNKQKCLIIAKCLKSSYNSISRDSEIYPEYVVCYLENDSDSNACTRSTRSTHSTRSTRSLLALESDLADSLSFDDSPDLIALEADLADSLFFDDSADLLDLESDLADSLFFDDSPDLLDLESDLADSLFFDDSPDLLDLEFDLADSLF